jgi:CBS domain-containing protein
VQLHCPVCGYENLTGAEVCDNCGADLGGHDLPQQAGSFRGALMGARLDALGIPQPVVVTSETTVADVIERMQAAETDAALVVDDDQLVGIFTDRDAVVKLAGKRLAARPVHEFMTSDPVVLRNDDPLAVAIHKMAVGGFRHIPIIDDGRAVGVVTARDVFRHLAAVLG